MAKSKKSVPKKSTSPKVDLPKKALSYLQNKTGWEKITLGAPQYRVTPSGETAIKFTGRHSKLTDLAPVSVFLNSKGEEVNEPSVAPRKKPKVPSKKQLLDNLANQADSKNKCEALCERVDQYLAKVCSTKYNSLNPCNERDQHNCSGNANGASKVDLVILIDTSGSMRTIGRIVSAAAARALANVDCPTDLEITWLGIAGTFPGTNFRETSANYLTHNGLCKTLTVPAVSGSPSNEEREEGARTIADISSCFNWRKGACRSIFYISDEKVHRGNTASDLDNSIFTNAAIAAANANNVTVFAHYINNLQSPPTPSQQNYIDLCQNTGGQEFINSTTSESSYVKLLNHAICKACGKCKTYKWEDAKPCISVTWGDSDCDCLETNDFEVLCITVCNPYNNLTFEDLKIGYVYVVDQHGNPVPNLPDGSPSVEIIPLGPICYGNIKPCIDDRPSCVSRQVVLHTRGAISGDYSIRMGNICYKISHGFSEEACFDFKLCKD